MSLSAVVCAVVVVSVSRIAAKAGYSPWWALVPAVTAGVGYATVAAVHSKARFGALSLHTILHSARALAIADAACLAVTVVLLVAFAVSEWPALAAVPATATASGTSMLTAPKRGRASARGANAAVMAELPARMRIRALPDATGQPAGWFASGALGSGRAELLGRVPVDGAPLLAQRDVGRPAPRAVAGGRAGPLVPPAPASASRDQPADSGAVEA